MIILRVYRGIHDHFPARRSEWVLAVIMVVWGWLLISPDPVFSRSAVWSQMAALAGEATWGWAAIAIGTFRLMALVINGTFSSTWYGRWSPHVRSLASFLSCFFWLQISFGLWASEASTTGLAVYPGLLVLDLMNVVAAASDAGQMDRAKRDGH